MTQRGSAPRFGVWMRPILRIATRDAAQVMGTRTWLGVLLAPLILVLLVGFLVAAVAVLLILVEVSAEEGDSSPLGNDRIALVMQDLDPALSPLLDELAHTLSQKPPEPPEEARVLLRFVRFLGEARSGEPGMVPSSASAPASDHAGLAAPEAADRGPETDPESRQASLAVDVLPEARWAEIEALVPSRYDAALLLLPGEDGRIRYRIAHDAGLLYSRVLARRLETRISTFNQLHPRQAEGVLPAFGLEDRRDGPADPWLVRLALVIGAFSIAFMYHSVGTQAVAGVLAGERESRTLEVLLSLPLSHRQILYGKLLGLVATTALPTALWTLALYLPARQYFGLELAYGPLSLVIAALLLFLMATGCAVSASSEGVAVARNRLGLVNLATLGTGALVGALSSGGWPEGWGSSRALLDALEGGLLAWQWGIGVSALLLLSAGLVLELGLTAFKRG